MPALPNLTLQSSATSSAYSGPGIAGNLTFNNGSPAGALDRSGPGELNAGVYANLGGGSNLMLIGAAAFFLFALLKGKK